MEFEKWRTLKVKNIKRYFSRTPTLSLVNLADRFFIAFKQSKYFFFFHKH